MENCTEAYRRSRILMSAVVVAGVAFAMIPIGARAQIGGGPCNHGVPPGSTACENGQNGEAYGGSYGVWDNNNFYLNDYSNFGFIEQQMWLYTTNPESRQLVEIGIRNGWAIGGDPCQCVAYEVYWSEHDSAGNEYPVFVANTDPFHAATHSYEIQRRYDIQYEWDVFYDSNYVGTATHQSYVGYEAQVGLLDSDCGPAGCTAVGPNSHSDTFHFRSLETRTFAGTWSYWPYQNTWIDDPCGTYPSGYCMNGTAYGSPSDWYNNKP